MIVITGSEGNVGRRLWTAFGPVTRVDRAGSPDIVVDLETDDLTRGPFFSALADAQALIHLATSADPGAPADVHLAAIGGTTRLVQACALAGVPRLVLASSDWAAPTDIGQTPIPYGQSKRAIEALAAIYDALPNLRAVALRIGWVPGHPDDVALAEKWLQDNYWPDDVLLARLREALSSP